MRSGGGGGGREQREGAGEEEGGEYQERRMRGRGGGITSVILELDERELSPEIVSGGGCLHHRSSI